MRSRTEVIRSFQTFFFNSFPKDFFLLLQKSNKTTKISPQKIEIRVFFLEIWKLRNRLRLLCQKYHQLMSSSESFVNHIRTFLRFQLPSAIRKYRCHKKWVSMKKDVQTHPMVHERWKVDEDLYLCVFLARRRRRKFVNWDQIENYVCNFKD